MGDNGIRIEAEYEDVTVPGDTERSYLTLGWWINGEWVDNPAFLPKDHGEWGWVIEKDGEVLRNTLDAPEILYQYKAYEKALDLRESATARLATKKEIEEFESVEDARYY